MGFISNSVPVVVGTTLCLAIHDYKVVESLYTTNNQYFDKHPIVFEATRRLTGQSILFGETNDNQKAKRKAMSPAFYKGKLQNMVDTAEQEIRKQIRKYKVACESNNGEITIDMVNDINNLLVRLLLACVIG